MEEIGRRLRAAREGKGITLEQAEEDTKIRQKYLHALEAGREADIPGEVYIKGFLRSYGNYLGLNGPALVEEYKRWKLQAKMKELAGQDAEPAASAGVSTAPSAQEPAVRQPDGESAARLAAAPPAPRLGLEGADPQAAPRSWAQRAAENAAEAAVSRSRADRPAQKAAEPVAPRSRAARSAGSAAERSARREAGEGSPGQRPSLSRTRSRGNGNRAMRRTLTILGVCLLLGGTAWALYYQLSGAAAGTPLDSAGQGDAQATLPDAAGEANGQPESGASFMETGTVSMKVGEEHQVHFTVRAPEADVRVDFGVDAVWLEAEGDGQLLFHGELPAGEKEPLFFKGQRIVIDMGFMDGISLTVNGERFEKPLEGGPWRLIFEAEAE